MAVAVAVAVAVGVRVAVAVSVGVAVGDLVMLAGCSAMLKISQSGLLLPSEVDQATGKAPVVPDVDWMCHAAPILACPKVSSFTPVIGVKPLGHVKVCVLPVLKKLVTANSPTAS